MEFLELMKAATTAPIKKRPVSNLNALNEAYNYAKPSSFVAACGSI